MVDDDGILWTVPLIPRRIHHDVVCYEHTVVVYLVAIVVDCWCHYYYYLRMKLVCMNRSGSMFERSRKLSQPSTTGTEIGTNISTNHVFVTEQSTGWDAAVIAVD